MERETPKAEVLAAEALEVAREACHTITVHQGTVEALPEYLTRCSKWTTVTRAIAYCFKYIDTLLERVQRPGHKTKQPHDLLQVYQRSTLLQVEMVPWNQLNVSIQHLESAESHIHRVQPSVAFGSEIVSLRRGHPVSKGSALYQMCPFLDERGLMRVGGRLQYSSLPWHQRHPIILPKDRVTNILIRHFHLSGLHSGLQLTLTLLREKYWVIHARNRVKHVISRCTTCARYAARPHTQQMSPLPAERCRESSPFTHVGVDYCEPFPMKHSSGRGRHAHKVWVLVFVCFSTRAIHLELVDDYSTASFLAAFKCFASRRGLPSTLNSDQGRNLLGACAELERTYRAITRSQEWQSYLVMQKIDWHLIPPEAPNHGGIWEAGVKAFKHHFKRILGTFTPSWDEMRSLLCQIEACLNSRPLTPTKDNVTEESALTPGHFLIGRSLKAVPERKVLDRNVSLLSRWHAVTLMVQTFWNRWRHEYLVGFLQRQKWQEKEDNVRVGDMVLLMEDNFPPCEWGLARVIATRAGPDQLVREVDVRTKGTVLTRPISKLCKLPAFDLSA